MTWIELFLECFGDTTIIVLMVAAVVSFAIGIYEDPAKGWIEGAAILAAVLIVAIVTATNNYNKVRTPHPTTVTMVSCRVAVLHLLLPPSHRAILSPSPHR